MQGSHQFGTAGPAELGSSLGSLGSLGSSRSPAARAAAHPVTHPCVAFARPSAMVSIVHDAQSRRRPAALLHPDPARLGHRPDHRSAPRAPPGCGAPGSGCSRSCRRTSSPAARRARTGRSPPSASTPSTSTSTPSRTSTPPPSTRPWATTGGARSSASAPPRASTTRRCARSRPARCAPRSTASTSASGRARRRAPRASPRSSSASARGSTTSRSTPRSASRTTAGAGRPGREERARPQPARARRGRATRDARRLLEFAYVQWTLHEQWEAARAQMRDARRRAHGRSALRRLRRERGRVVPRLAVPAPPVARRAARRLLGRRAGLGASPVRLAGDGGRRPRVDPRAHARTRRSSTTGSGSTTSSATSASGSKTARARHAVASIPRGWTRSARAGAACSARCSRSSRTPTTSSRRARSRRTSASSRPFVRDVAARARDARVPRPPLGEGRRRGLPRSAVLPGGRASSSWSTHDTAPIVSWWDELPADDRAALGGARRRPARDATSGRARSRCWATSTARAPTSRSSSRRSCSGWAIASTPRRRWGSRTGAGACRARSRTSQADAAVMSPLRGRARARRGVREVGTEVVSLPFLAHADRTGQPSIRSAPPGTGRASTSRSSASTPPPSSSASSTTRGARDPPARPLADAHVWHGYVPGLRPRPALRLAGARAVRPGRRATASTRTSSWSIRTRARSTARSICAAPSTAYRRAAARTTASSTTATTPPASRARSSSIAASTGRDDRPPRVPVARHGALRAARQGLHPAAPRVPESLRGTYLGLASDARHRAPRSRWG